MITKSRTIAIAAALSFLTVFAAAAKAQTKAPDFSLRSIDGEPVTAESLRGEVAVLAFGASWLPLSRNQLEGVKKLADDYSGRGVAVYWVSTDSESPKSKNYASDDQLRALARKYKVTVSRHTVRRDTAAGRSIIDRFSHRAWQVAGSVFLTGEKASFRSLTPKHPFDPKSGTWGALEVTARIQGTSVPDEVFPVFADPATSVQSIRAWALGLNWHLAKNVKLMMDYERAVFHGGAVAGNRRAENLLITRFQTAF